MVVAGLLALSLTAVPLTAWAQAGWYYIPSLSLYEEFDDNIFSSTNRTSDFITRRANGWKIGYRSRPFTLLLTSSLDGELFANHHELDGLNRTQVGLESEWIPTLPLTLRLSALFTKTQTPSELAPNLGLQLGRRDSTQLASRHRPCIASTCEPRPSSRIRIFRANPKEERARPTSHDCGSSSGYPTSTQAR